MIERKSRLDHFRPDWLFRTVWTDNTKVYNQIPPLLLFSLKRNHSQRFHVFLGLSWVKWSTWFERVKGWDWDDRYSGAHHQRRCSVQWCVSVWVCLSRSLYSSAVWDSCFSYRLRTWCTNWYCSLVWIIPPLRSTKSTNKSNISDMMKMEACFLLCWIILWFQDDTLNRDDMKNIPSFFFSRVCLLAHYY